MLKILQHFSIAMPQLNINVMQNAQTRLFSTKFYRVLFNYATRKYLQLLFKAVPISNTSVILYMLQGICETRKYVYFLKLSVNTRIP